MMPPSLADSQQVYAGPRFKVRKVRCTIERDGKTLQRDRDAVVTADSVVILPLLDPHTVVMIRNDRFVVGQRLWELPAGTMEAGEDPDECAARELIEETGYRAGDLQKMTEFYPTPGLCTEFMRVYWATDLQHVGQDLDDTEQIEVEPVPMDQLLRMIREGVIRDGKTIAAVLYYRTFIRGE